MSEFIVTSDTSGGIVKTGHRTVRLLSGDGAAVKTKLSAAAERLGYYVVNEQPLQLKRPATTEKIGKLINSFTEVSINLKPVSAVATQATFDYEIVSASLYKGDHTTIEREVDAIVALAARTSQAAFCGTCGTTTGPESLYCRSCGMPATPSDPAELEVLRLNNEGRYAHRSNITGLVMQIISLAAGLPLILYGSGKGISLGWAIFILGQIAAAGSVFLGAYVNHKALNPKAEEKGLPRVTSPMLAVDDPVRLPPTTFGESVTEGTTELLPAPLQRQTDKLGAESRVRPE